MRAAAPEPQIAAATPALPVPDTRQDSAALLYNLLVGEIAGQRQSYEISATHYIAAARQSREPALARRAAQMALHAGLFDLAVEAAQTWAELDPEGSDAYQVLAALHLQRGDREAAREPLRRLLERTDLDSSEDYLALARFFRHGDDFRPLLVMMEEVIRQRPDDPDALYAFVLIAVQMGEVDKASRESARLVELEPDRPRSALLHAQLLNVAGRTAQSAEFLARFVAAHPQVFDTRLALARLLVDLDRLGEALTHFERLHRDAPQDQDVLFALALVSLQEGHLAQARDHLERLLVLEPDSDRAAFYLARVREAQGEFDAALEQYRRVESPQYRIEAALRRARLLGQRGRLPEALEALHAVRGATSAQQIELIVLEVDLLLDAGAAERAVAVAATALETFPENIDLLFSLGMAYEKLGDLAAMERYMRRVLALEPQNAHALNALGYTFADRGVRLEEALEMISQAHEIAPDNPYVLDSMGWIQYRLGRYDAALRYLKRALEIMPDPEIYAHLGEVLWVMGEVAEAREVLTRGLLETPDDQRILGVLRKLSP